MGNTYGRFEATTILPHVGNYSSTCLTFQEQSNRCENLTSKWIRFLSIFIPHLPPRFFHSSLPYHFSFVPFFCVSLSYIDILRIAPVLIRGEFLYQANSLTFIHSLPVLYVNYCSEAGRVWMLSLAGSECFYCIRTWRILWQIFGDKPVATAGVCLHAR
jgi:hypothetical protein